MECVLPNTICRKCPSEQDATYPFKHLALCPSEDKTGNMLELKENCSSHIRVLPSN